jgi:HD-GYP domain-containing protein (c-di-GMP phosphodiesterase class II)
VRLSDIVRSGERPGAPPPAEPRTASDPTGPAAPPAPPERAPVEPAVPTAERAPGAAPPPAVRRGPSTRSREHDAADTIFERATERIRQSLAVRSEAPFSIGQAQEAVDILLQSLEASDALLMAFFRSPEKDPSQGRKAVNVTILALKMGLELGQAREQLRELGLAALFCDIGTTLMPESLLASPGPLTASERDDLRSHQLEAAGLLGKLAPEYRWIGEVIRRRYEQVEGTYEADDRFDEYAAIVHLADTYRSLVHPRPPRRRLGPLDALKAILQRHRVRFPDRILKALIRAMSTFPVGSLVRLNTGEVGRVIERNRDYPLRPVVEILVRRGKWLAEPGRVDLAQNPLVYIKESVVEDEVS